MVADAYWLHVNRVVEMREDGVYAAYIPGLGVVGYGDSAPGAVADCKNVVFTMLNHIYTRDGIGATLSRLSRAGVRWQPVDVGYMDAGEMIRVEDNRLVPA